MRRAMGGGALGVPVRREDGLEPQLGDALLPAGPSHRGVGALTAEERPRPLGVPRAALVVADPPRPGVEERPANGVEGLAGHEDDEFPVHGYRHYPPGTRSP